MQLPFCQLLTNWLQTQSELKLLVDTDCIGVAGHSRGAKLAALHFASGKPILLPAKYRRLQNLPRYDAVTSFPYIYILASDTPSRGPSSTPADGYSLTVSVCMHVGSQGIKAAFLVDPVDNTQETPEGPDYPSAAKALQVTGRPVAMCGASIIGSCNPAGSNWQVFAYYHVPVCYLRLASGCR